MSIAVLKPGLQSTLQSRPRTGLRHQGVPAGGAADPLSLALANRLVGNAWDAPAIESTLLGPVLRFDVDCAIAITGARAEATVGARRAPWHETLFVDRGDTLAVATCESGARVYIAVAGGFGADDVLGSPSTNLQAGFGGLQGRALRKGDILRVREGNTERFVTPDAFRPPMPSSWALRTSVAAETDSLDNEGLGRLFDTNWTVDRRADRMGLRLDGPRLETRADGRMPSAPVFPGTIQCPGDGAPYILSVDAGTVGGYPRIAQVSRADRHVLGQLRPGDHVRLLRREPDDAIAELRDKIDYWREWLPDAADVFR